MFTWIHRLAAQEGRFLQFLLLNVPFSRLFSWISLIAWIYSPFVTTAPKLLSPFVHMGRMTNGWGLTVTWTLGIRDRGVFVGE